MKLAAVGHLLRLDAEVLDDNLLDPLGNVLTHRFNPHIFSLAAPRERSRRGHVVAEGGVPDRTRPKTSVRMVPKARRPRQAEVRLPHFPSLGQRTSPASPDRIRP